MAEKGGKATITIRTIISSREGAGTTEGIAATTEVATVMSMKKSKTIINDPKMTRPTTERSTISSKTTNPRITTEAGSATTSRARISSGKAATTRT